MAAKLPNKTTLMLPPEEVNITSNVLIVPNRKTDWSVFDAFKSPDAVGFDNSFRYSGFAIRKGQSILTGVISPCAAEKYKKRGYGESTRLAESIDTTPSVALDFIEEAYRQLFFYIGAEFVCVEDPIIPSFSNKHTLQQYYAYSRLLKVMREFDVVALIEKPSVIKKIATGKGSADKKLMVATANILYEHTPFIENSVANREDQVDALFICNMGVYYDLLGLTPRSDY